MILVDALSAFAYLIAACYLIALAIFFLPYRKTAQIKKFPLVSVIIAAKNEEGVIGKTLKALKKMDYPKFEIIIADSSTDATAKIAKKYADKILIDKKCSKPDILNKAVKKAKGEILYILDADCIVEKDALTKLVSAIDGYDAAVGANLPANKQNAIAYIGRIELAYLSVLDKIINRVAKTAIIPGRNYVIRKKALKAIGGFKNVLTEDLNLSWRMYKRRKRIDITPAISREQVPTRISWYLRQQERWDAGTFHEIHSSAKHLSAIEKFVYMPYILFLSSLPIALALSIILYALNANMIFLAVVLLSLLLTAMSSARFLEPKDTVFSPVTSIAYGFLQLIMAVFSGLEALTGKKVTWRRTPKEKVK